MESETEKIQHFVGGIFMERKHTGRLNEKDRAGFKRGLDDGV